MGDHSLDIAKGEAVAIRAGLPDEEILLGRKIADVPWALYCSRSYLDRHGRVERTEDLDRHARMKSMATLEITMRPDALRWVQLQMPRSSQGAIPCRD